MRRERGYSEESEAETSETESDSEAETEAETEAFSDDFGVWTALAGDNGTTYPNLFKVILSDEDYSYRYDYSAAVVGEDNAKSTVDYLRSFISADIYGDDYADTELYTVIGEDGHGETYMNGEKSADYNAYAYDNDEKGDGKGIYVAYSNLTGEVSHAEYSIEEEDGKTVLTFVNDEGAISYVKRAE